MAELGFIRKTSYVFKASGGDVVWTPSSTTTDQAGRRSARLDLGVTAAVPKPRLYEWRATITNGASTGTLGRGVYLYLITATASTGAVGTDGGETETDAALAGSDDRRNLTPIGVVVCDATAATSVYRKSGLLWISARYIQIAHWNDLGVAISSTATDHDFTLTPIPDYTA